tara:strand:- start:154 stop:858 length:705 start_codon:yes stop_codon:yes gene_type:complete
MKNKIIFTTSVPGLLEHKELYPQPAKNYTPDWYKNIPIDIKDNNKFVSKVIPNNKTVKMCPSFNDVFKDGYVIVAHCDIYLRVDKDGYWEWQTPDDLFPLDMHPDSQMLDYIKHTNVKKIFKLVNPWYCITPKGWSIKQIPLLYNFNPDWYVGYGILNTDVQHEINQQIFYTSDSNEILIKRGTPLNYIVPYKRSNKLNMDVVPMNNTLSNKIDKGIRLVRSSFKASSLYYRNS